MSKDFSKEDYEKAFSQLKEILDFDCLSDGNIILRKSWIELTTLRKIQQNYPDLFQILKE